MEDWQEMLPTIMLSNGMDDKEVTIKGFITSVSTLWIEPDDGSTCLGAEVNGVPYIIVPYTPEVEALMNGIIEATKESWGTNTPYPTLWLSSGQGEEAIIVHNWHVETRIFSADMLEEWYESYVQGGKPQLIIPQTPRVKAIVDAEFKRYSEWVEKQNKTQ